MPAEPVRKTDWNAELASWSDEDFVQAFHERPDLADRLRKVLADPVKVPSDAEVGQILKEVLHNSRYGVHQWELWLEFASALFTRYGGGTP